MKQIEKLRSNAKEIVLKEGKYLLEKSSDITSYDTKSSYRDLVTSLDIEIENRLKEKLSKILPGCTFLAEESSPTADNYDKVWIIDPIDGTTNFVHNLQFYCISVALYLDGKPTLGYVYSPALDEFFEAQRGMGSYLNNKKIAVSKADMLSNSLLVTGFAYNFAQCKDNNFNHFHYFQGASFGVRRLGSAAIDICYVAKGVFAGFWELYLNPWDVAAGILIAQEAGGIVSNFQGDAYTFDDVGILVTNGLIHQEMLKGLNEQE